MKKTVLAFAFLLAPLFACAAESTGDDTGDDSTLAPYEDGKPNLSIDPELAAASCGNVTLDYCRDPRFPSQVTASCHPQRRCSCAEEIEICKSLVRQYCGAVENIVVSNCDR